MQTIIILLGTAFRRSKQTASFCSRSVASIHTVHGYGSCLQVPQAFMDSSEFFNIKRQYNPNSCINKFHK